MSNIKALRQKKADLTKQLRGIIDGAAKEDRDLNEAEGAKYNEILATLKGVEQGLEREEKVLEFERGVEGVAIDAADDPTGEAKDKKPGFKSLGEFLVATVQASRGHGRGLDPRLVQAAASGMSESVPSDGGFLVQKDFSAELITRAYDSGQIMSRVRKIPISSNANGLKINAVDETSRADGSRWGGILAYWINEAGFKPNTSPKFRQLELNLNKLVGFCFATDELLEDASALEATITQAFPEEFNFKLEDSVLNGTGAGQPLGILNSGALIVVAKDAADSTATVSTNDILAMWSRLWARSRPNAVWIINQDVERALYPMTLGTGTATQLLYTPPGQNGNQYAMLLGRPVIPTEHSASLGTLGDVLLADFSQYLVIDKGAPKSASSIHVRFQNDETAFRFVYRVDGQPVWNKPLTPKNGANTTSPFVVLAARP